MDGSFLVAGAARAQDAGGGWPGGPGAAPELTPVHLGRDGPTRPVEQGTSRVPAPGRVTGCVDDSASGPLR
ncbi:hypothetical protein, partial [Actinomyces sp.]|uniref:hypothetical protein n=1 Tax=Actinomyces sp. TaxID=29317 RepID=UPI002897C57F